MILRNKRRPPPNAFLGKKPNLDATTELGCFFKGQLQAYFDWVKKNNLSFRWMSSDDTDQDVPTASVTPDIALSNNCDECFWRRC